MILFLFIVFSGFAVNAVRLADLAHTPRRARPKTFSGPIYLFRFFVLPFVGGGLAYSRSLVHKTLANRGSFETAITAG